MYYRNIYIENLWEYNVPIWLALVDFEKAFDSVEHLALWDVLEKQAVPSHYIDLVKHLYAQQAGYVQAGRSSQKFSITRGVKQGDPISALLFIAVMQDLLGTLKSRWEALNARRKNIKIGIKLNHEAILTNLRFADDVILTAQSKEDITKMFFQFSEAAKKYGLDMHYGKTKVMTWDALASGCKSVRVDGKDVAILKERC